MLEPDATGQLACGAAKEAGAGDSPCCGEPLVLSAADRAAVFDILVNPPAPSLRLVRALRLHRERIR
jgi:hypothetical protein